MILFGILNFILKCLLKYTFTMYYFEIIVYRATRLQSLYNYLYVYSSTPQVLIFEKLYRYTKLNYQFVYQYYKKLNWFKMLEDDKSNKKVINAIDRQKHLLSKKW